VPVYTKINVHKEHGGGGTEYRLTALSKDIHQVPSGGPTKLQSLSHNTKAANIVQCGREGAKGCKRIAAQTDKNSSH